ncbi:MAG: flavodoxin family protein [Candidatus Bathyarchaeota archaeon]|nr:flavodoxin family protein [Candidatus Bathyarchaeota archaeon]
MTRKVVGIQSSANLDGLTCQLAQAVLDGAKGKRAETELVHLNKLKIGPCKAHGRGWGTCRTEGECMIKDDLQDLREKINQADALVFSTPVYFGDISESARCFLDRWRRCEIFNRESSPLKDKPVIGISAAGGTGGGAVNALHALETYLRKLQFSIFDLVPVTQLSKGHKIGMLKIAGRRMAVHLEKL